MIEFRDETNDGTRVFILDFTLKLAGATEDTLAKAEFISAITDLPLKKVIKYLKPIKDDAEGDE